MIFSAWATFKMNKREPGYFADFYYTADDGVATGIRSGEPLQQHPARSTLLIVRNASRLPLFHPVLNFTHMLDAVCWDNGSTTTPHLCNDRISLACSQGHSSSPGASHGNCLFFFDFFPIIILKRFLLKLDFLTN
eukprot:scpid39431/ scgid16902/ 